MGAGHPSLTSWLTRYVEVERHELLAGRVSDAMWVNCDGAPLGLAGIEKRIRRLSAKRFGPKNAFNRSYSPRVCGEAGGRGVNC